MNVQGLIIGAAAFAVIGIFHPIVIQAEYHIGKKIWPAFLLVGLLLIAASACLRHTSASAIAGIAGFSCLWSIHELFEQEQRVKKGWFPRKPGKPSDRT